MITQPYPHSMHPLRNDVALVLHRHGCLIHEVSVLDQPVSEALHVLIPEGHANVTIEDATRVTWEWWKWEGPGSSHKYAYSGEMTFDGGWQDGGHRLAQRIATEVGADFGECPKGCSG